MLKSCNNVLFLLNLTFEIKWKNKGGTLLSNTNFAKLKKLCIPFLEIFCDEPLTNRKKKSFVKYVFQNCRSVYTIIIFLEWYMCACVRV